MNQERMESLKNRVNENLSEFVEVLAATMDREN